MPEEEKQGEMPPAEGETPNAPNAGKTTQELEQELAKVTAALKEANKEAAARRKKLEEYESVQKANEDAKLSEMEKLQKRLADAETQLKAREYADLQRQAAEKAKLPLVFAPRLKGETLEELEKDAAELAKSIKPSTPNVGATNPGAGASQKETLDQQRARIYGTGVDPLDPEFAKSHGGGILWPKEGL